MDTILRILRFLRFFGLLLMLASPRVYAAIGFDAVASAASAGGASSLSWSHTATGSNLVLDVGCEYAGDTTASLSSVTYGGTALTFIRRDMNTAGFNPGSEKWYLKAPATGANTIVATLNHALPAANALVCGSITLTGVDQTNPLDAHNGAVGGPGGTATVSVTTVADNAWLIDALSGGYLDGWTADASQTQRYAKNNGAGNDPEGWGSTKGPVSPPAATAMAWTGGAVRWAISAVSWKPAAGGGGGVAPKLPLLGVGPLAILSPSGGGGQALSWDVDPLSRAGRLLGLFDSAGACA